MKASNMKTMFLGFLAFTIATKDVAFAAPIEQSQASMAVKMTAFEMPSEYNCPLFSNSPYTDMLLSLDKMQENLNTVFPACEGKANNVKLNETSNELHLKIIEAQNYQKNGQSYKLTQSSNRIVELSRMLQQSLVSMSTLQTKACYRSEAQFRNVIFSINDTFQSLAPMILDLASQNPVVAQSLGPALKIFAGADAISKGLSLIEQIAKDSIQFDMTDKDNRINTIKNTCQFMKLYNRLMYMRLSRLGQTQAIHSKFQSEISEMNKKVGIANGNRQQAMTQKNGKNIMDMFISGSGSQPSVVDNRLVLFEKLKTTIPQEQNLIQKVLSDFDLAKTDFNFPEITQCQLIKSSLKSIPLESLIIDVKTFSEITQASEELRLDLDGLDDYRNDLEKAIASNDRQLCTQLGQDWLRKMDRLFLSARQMVASYEMKLIELNGEAYLIKQKKIAKDIETLNSTVSDYKNLKTMLNYAAFESSEVEKRAKGMHKYLFAKPDSIVSECVGRAEENKCGPLEGLSGVVKAMYQKYRNQGPIYELLLNNEKYFNDSMMKLGKTMISIIQFENQFLPPQMKKMLEGAYSSKLIQFMEVRDKNAFAMDHLTPSFLVKGTASYAQICSQAKIVVNEYLKATNHMMSSYGMCQMIKNVLHEPEVSKSLKNYCLPSSPSQDSKLNNLRYRLAGRYATSVEKTVTSGQLFSRSPKAFVDQLLIRMDELGCYTD